MRSVNIVASDDELLLSARSESGGLVEALVDGLPMNPDARNRQGHVPES